MATLLSHTLGDEEIADFLLTLISKPLLQQATLEDMGADVDLDTVAVNHGASALTKRKKASK